MPTFVLVHGSHGGGWIWQKLARRLCGAGHEVYTPGLTGLSDRSHLLECGVNLTADITDVVNLLTFEDLSDVVLVGNSYVGMVITGVAARAPERLKLLIDLDAYVPDAGQSELDLLLAEMRAARKAEAAAQGGLTLPPPPVIFGVTDPSLVEWVKMRWTPHPFATFAEPVPRGMVMSEGLPRVFIH